MTTVSSSAVQDRWQEITQIWKKDTWLYGITGLLAGFIFGIAASSELRQFISWFWEGFWNEALSIAITVIVLDRLNQLRAQEERKLALFRQTKSRANDAAVDALDQIIQQVLGVLWDIMIMLCGYHLEEDNFLHIFPMDIQEIVLHGLKDH